MLGNLVTIHRVVTMHGYDNVVIMYKIVKRAVQCHGGSLQEEKLLYT